MPADQFEVRLVIEQQLAAGMAAARRATANGPTTSSTTTAETAGKTGQPVSDGFREKVRQERERIRRGREDDREERSGVSRYIEGKLAARSGTVGQMSRRVSEIAAGRADARGNRRFRELRQAGASLEDATNATAGSTSLAAGIRSVGTAGVVLAGGAKVIESMAPLLVSMFTEMMASSLGLKHLPGGLGDKFSDEISGKISEVINSVMAAVSSVGSTLGMERAKVRLGGTTSLEQAAGTYKMFHEVSRQRGELEDRFARDINRDLGRQLGRLALGSG